MDISIMSNTDSSFICAVAQGSRYSAKSLSLNLA